VEGVVNFSSAFASAWLLLLGLPLLHAAENPGIKIVQQDPSGLSNQRTTYLQADRKRFEFRNATGRQGTDGSLQATYGPRIVFITRCDLAQSFVLNLDASEYSSGPHPHPPLTREEIAASGLLTPVNYVSDKPTLRIEVTTHDTGERKEMFGYKARHVITTRKEIPLAGAVSGPQESVTDGWYIDPKPIASSDIDLRRQQLSCDPKPPEGKRVRAYSRLAGGNRPVDRVEFQANGEEERGFPLQSVMTSKGTFSQSNGTTKQVDSKLEMRVVELEVGPLDPALFEIPPGFKKVDHIEMNPSASAFANPPKGLWQRVKDSMANLFSR
jgi:hypothetical protein